MIKIVNATHLRLITAPHVGLCYEDCTSWTGCDCPQIFEL